MLRTLLLIVHIAGGAVALASLVPVVASSWGTGIRVSRRHATYGRLYGWSMVVALAAAYPLSVIMPSAFLGAVAVFTTYLVASGWRWIRRDHSQTVALGKLLAIGMQIAAVVMVILGIDQLRDDDQLGIVLFVFAGIGSALAVQDLVSLRGDRPPRREQVALHFGRMLGGAIATITAVLVVNVSLEPEWLVWTMPSIMISPMIAIRSALVLRPQSARS